MARRASLGGTIADRLRFLGDRAAVRCLGKAKGGRAHAVDVSDALQTGDLLLLDNALAFRELVVRGQHGLTDGAQIRVDNAILADVPASP